MTCCARIHPLVTCVARGGVGVFQHDVFGGQLTHDVDDVIAATGFITPLRDLPDLGVATFGQSRLPAQTAVRPSAVWLLEAASAAAL